MIASFSPAADQTDCQGSTTPWPRRLPSDLTPVVPRPILSSTSNSEPDRDREDDDGSQSEAPCRRGFTLSSANHNAATPMNATAAMRTLPDSRRAFAERINPLIDARSSRFPTVMFGVGPSPPHLESVMTARSAYLRRQQLRLSSSRSRASYRLQAIATRVGADGRFSRHGREGSTQPRMHISAPSESRQGFAS